MADKIEEIRERHETTLDEIGERGPGGYEWLERREELYINEWPGFFVQDVPALLAKVERLQTVNKDQRERIVGLKRVLGAAQQLLTEYERGCCNDG